MSRKTKNRGVLEVLQEGPQYPYGSETDEERECVDCAKRMLLEAKEPVEYRTKLLEALLRFQRRIVQDEAAMDAAGESS
jgi:hypothetical protein